MQKKIRYYQEQILFLNPLIGSHINRSLLNSLFLNKKILSKKRFIYLSQQYYLFNIYAHTKCKLRCTMTLSKSVPNSKYRVGRFYLTKFSDYLLMGNFYKK